MTIEQKVNTRRRSLIHPFGKSIWVPVEIPTDYRTPLPEVPLTGNRRAILGKNLDRDLARIDKIHPSGAYDLSESKVYVDEEINKGPFAGRIRRKRA